MQCEAPYSPVVLYRSLHTFEDNFTMGGCLAALWTFVVVFLGSTAIGVFIALASALFFKRFKLSDDGAHVAHPSGYTPRAGGVGAGAVGIGGSGGGGEGNNGGGVGDATPSGKVRASRLRGIQG